MEFRDLGAQYRDMKDDIDSAIMKVLSTGQFIGGNQVQKLENALANCVGVKHCITCANGTDALQLALMAWDIGPNDAVFIPDFTFFSTGEVVAAVGATPVFVDVDEMTFNLSAESLVQAIEYVKTNTDLRPKAVIAVDLFGLPADYLKIMPICIENDLLLLEDGAQGFGGSILGQRACSFGDISTTSFFPAKPLGCYGDGGAIFTDDDEWAQLIKSLAVHGKGFMKYDNVRVGMNSRLDSIQAAILNVKLMAFENTEVDKVNEYAAKYEQLLNPVAARLGIRLPHIPDKFVSSWAQYTLVTRDEAQRNLIKSFLSDNDIPSMIYYPKPMSMQQAFEGIGLILPSGCPVTSNLCQRVLSLPMGPYLSEGNIERITNVLNSISE